MEGLLPLAVLIGASGSLLAYHRQARRSAQGFEDLLAPGVENAFGREHAQYIRKSAEKYNPIANLINPLKNPMVPSDADPSAIAAVEQTVRAAFQTANAKPGRNSYDLVSTKVSNILLNKDPQGTGIRRVEMCERVKTTDCSAFDNPQFTANCGICMDGGRDSGGNPMVGGLLVEEEDKMDSEENAKRMNSRRTNYTPSVGSCAPYMLATNKQQCIKLKSQLECARKQNFEVPGCSNCLQDEKFYYLQDGFIKSQPAIYLQGQGAAVLKRTGQDDKKFNLSTSPTRFELVGLDEGDAFALSVQGEDSYVSGYLEGITPSGQFRIDIIRLVQSDTITGTRPRLAGMQEMNGENMSLIRPGRGKTEFNLAMLNPFTFIEPTEEEAAQCSSSPFVMKETSANFLNSSPCYKKGQGPGKYSLECLQQTFETAGCTAKGTGYPSNDARAQGLMTDGFGKVRSIGQIAQRIYEAGLMAATGKTISGQQLTIEQWSAESVFCTGKEIKSPCDVADPKGNISTDCISYLWNNSGAYQTVAGGPGQTYTNGIATTSLNEKNQTRYCTSNGTMAPVGKNGTLNQEAIQIARSKGGIQQIKDFYDNIHKRANDNALDVIQRKDAILQCYGVNVVDVAGPQGPKMDIGDPNQYISLLDNPVGRTKTGLLTRNYTPIPAVVLPSYVLGPRGMPPWGNQWVSELPPGDASWISAIPTANYNSATGHVDALQKIYINDTSKVQNATIFCVFDDLGSVAVNNARIPMAGRLSFMTKFNVSFPPGENMIYVESKNTGGPAGFICICVDQNTGNILFQTDKSWIGLNRAIYGGG